MNHQLSMHEWKAKGRFIQIEHVGQSHSVFCIDTEEENKPVLLILHGYPTCVYDYWKALPLLSKKYRVVMHDHLGFGLSDKPEGYAYQLIDQAEIALSLWQKLGIAQASILAHDYGTSVATEIIARHNEAALTLKLNAVTLCNGSMHIELSQLRPIQKLLKNRWVGPVVARLATKATLQRNFRRIYSDASKVETKEVDVLWELMLHNKGRKVLSKITSYIDQRYTHWERWIGALKTTDLPLHILWAEDDPVAVVKMAEVIHAETKHSRLTILDNLGHFPMLEDAERWASHV